MIITLIPNISAAQLGRLETKLRDMGFSLTSVKTQGHHYLVAVGKRECDIREIGHAEGVADVHRVDDAFKLVSRKWRVDPTAIDLGDGIRIVEGELALIPGPCAVESEHQIETLCGHLAAHGLKIMRGGAFKPRTSPYAFRGLGLDGLRMFKRIAASHGIRIVSEVVAASQIEAMYEHVDIFQVGTRNSQNFDLLDELGKVDKPVLIKRAMSGTLDELLQSAEYVFSSGNERLILCERGIRGIEPSYRNILDLNAVPALKEKSHLPVLVDPSHGIGVRRWVEPLALAAVAAGADGLLFEVHEKPEEAVSDGQQTLNFDESSALIEKSRALYTFIHSNKQRYA